MARVLYVPENYPTIQAAYDVAVDGDTVSVAGATADGKPISYGGATLSLDKAVTVCGGRVVGELDEDAMIYKILGDHRREDTA